MTKEKYENILLFALLSQKMLVFCFSFVIAFKIFSMPSKTKPVLDVQVMSAPEVSTLSLRCFSIYFSNDLKSLKTCI